SAGHLLIPISFVFTVTSVTVLSSLSLHDALPILSWFGSGRSADAASRSSTSRSSERRTSSASVAGSVSRSRAATRSRQPTPSSRSEEHTSELQSREKLVCRLLLEKKKQHQNQTQQ